MTKDTAANCPILERILSSTPPGISQKLLKQYQTSILQNMMDYIKAGSEDVMVMFKEGVLGVSVERSLCGLAVFCARLVDKVQPSLPRSSSSLPSFPLPSLLSSPPLPPSSCRYGKGTLPPPFHLRGDYRAIPSPSCTVGVAWLLPEPLPHRLHLPVLDGGAVKENSEDNAPHGHPAQPKPVDPVPGIPCARF